MIVCPSCGHHNPEESVSCEECQGSLEQFVYRACPACQALNPSQNTFCHRCLTKLVEDQLSDAEPTDLHVEPFYPDAATRHPIAPPRVQARPLDEEPSAPKESATAEQSADVPETDQDEQGQQMEPVAVSQPAVAPQASTPTEPQTEPEEETQAGAEEPPLEAPAQIEAEPSGEPAFAAPLQPVSPSHGPEATKEAVLDGLQDTLPLERVVSLPHREQPLASAAGLSETDQFDAKLLKEVVSEPTPLGASTQVIISQRSRVLPRIGRTLLYLFIVVAALVPLFTPGFTQDWVMPRRSAAELHSAISALPDDATVLIAFDYEPAYAEDLAPLAESALRQLASRSTRMLALATKPAGTGLAVQAFERISDEYPEYRTYGERYAILGYLPGEEAGLRTLNTGLDAAFKHDMVLASPILSLPVAQGNSTLDTITCILILSDDTASVRRWVEQIGSRRDIGLHVLSTARIYASLVPYEQSEQIQTLVSGAHQALELNKAAGLASAQVGLSDGLAAFFILIAAVALLANIVYLIKRK